MGPNDLVDYYAVWDFTPVGEALRLIDESGVMLGVSVLSLAVSIAAGYEFFRFARAGATRSQIVGSVAGSAYSFGFLLYITWVSTVGFGVSEWVASFGSKYVALYLPMLACLLVVFLHIGASERRGHLVGIAIAFALLGFVVAIACAFLFLWFYGNETVSWLIIGGVCASLFLACPVITFEHGRRIKIQEGFGPLGLSSAPAGSSVKASCGIVVVSMIAMQLLAVFAMNTPGVLPLSGRSNDSSYDGITRWYNMMLVTSKLEYLDKDRNVRLRYEEENDGSGRMIAYDQYEWDENANDGVGGLKRTFKASREWKSREDLVSEIRNGEYKYGAKLFGDNGTILTCKRYYKSNEDDGWVVCEYDDVGDARQCVRMLYLNDDVSVNEEITYMYGEDGRTESLVKKNGNGDQVGTGVYNYRDDGVFTIDITNTSGDDELWTYYADGTIDVDLSSGHHERRYTNGTAEVREADGSTYTYKYSSTVRR